MKIKKGHKLPLIAGLILVAFLFYQYSGLFVIDTEICNYQFNDTGLVGYWNLDNEALNQHDGSGNSNTGSVENATYTTGKFGGGYHFNGQDTSIIIPSSKELNLTNGLTLSAWIKLDNQTAYDRIVAKSFVNNSAPWTMFGLVMSGGPATPTEMKGQVRMELAQNGTQHLVHSVSYPQIGEWVHVVGTYDAVTGEAKLYYNGALESEQPYQYNPPAQYENMSGPLDFTDMPVVIGWDGVYPTGNHFNGTIDEVMIFNRAISMSEVQVLYTLQSNDKKCFNYNKTITGTINLNATSEQICNSSGGTYANLTCTCSNGNIWNETSTSKVCGSSTLTNVVENKIEVPSTWLEKFGLAGIIFIVMTILLIIAMVGKKKK